MDDKQLTPIENTKKQEEQKMEFPNLKKTEVKEDDLVKLPEWNIEPPLEINRGQQNDIR